MRWTQTLLGMLFWFSALWVSGQPKVGIVQWERFSSRHPAMYHFKQTPSKRSHDLFVRVEHWEKERERLIEILLEGEIGPDVGDSLKALMYALQDKIHLSLDSSSVRYAAARDSVLALIWEQTLQRAIALGFDTLVQAEAFWEGTYPDLTAQLMDGNVFIAFVEYDTLFASHPIAIELMRQLEVQHPPRTISHLGYLMPLNKDHGTSLEIQQRLMAIDSIEKMEMEAAAEWERQRSMAWQTRLDQIRSVVEPLIQAEAALAGCILVMDEDTVLYADPLTTVNITQGVLRRFPRTGSR